MKQRGMNIRNKLHDRALESLTRWCWTREYRRVLERASLYRILEVQGYSLKGLTMMLTELLGDSPVVWHRQAGLLVAYYDLGEDHGHRLVLRIRALQERMEELRKGLRGRAELAPVRQPALDDAAAGAPEVVAPGGGVDVE